MSSLATRPSSKLIFISYSRANTDFARDLYDKLEALGFKLWRDRSEMEAGEDWWQQIQEAIRSVESLVLVISPQALASPIVTKEWRYARQVGTRVIPVIAEDIEFKTIPRWIAKLDSLDFREGAPESALIWKKFLAQLQTSYQRVRVPFTAPDFPERFVQRPVEFNALIDRLLDASHENPTTATVVLKGSGGFGKTTLALALCHDERIQAAFDGGILWITLGEQPNLVGLVTDQIKLLSGEQASFSDLVTATARFKELLADRDILLVLDDVWDDSHVRAFMTNSTNCARLITTRRQDVAARVGGTAIDVYQMQARESARLLLAWLDELPADMRPFEALAHDLGGWPLMLRLAGAYLHDAVMIDQQSLTDALAGLRQRLARRGFTAFDRADEGQRNRAISISLEASLSRLGKWRDRYLELAVFPEDAKIPFSVIERLWAATAKLDDLDTEDALKAIHRLSLFDTYDPALQTIQLHDVVRSYLIAQQGEKLPALHGTLLDAYSVVRWAELPFENGYLWANLVYHLQGADRTAEMTTTMKDLYYLANKVYTQNAYAAELDLLMAEQQNPDDKTLPILRRNFATMSHLLSFCGTPNEIAATLHSRLQHIPELAESCRTLEVELKRPYLAAWHHLPDLPHPALIRTLSGHTDHVTGCAISATEDTIVSASRDGSLKIWDTATGAERFTLQRHGDWLTSCAISPDGDWLVSGSGDTTLNIWDARRGDARMTLRGHRERINKCAVASSGKWIVSASADKTLKVWDAKTGAERFTLRGHSGRINDCATAEEVIVSASSDNTLKVWDAQTGEERLTLQGHERRVNACAINLAANIIVSASLDETLKVWDAQTGQELQTLRGHSGEVTDCAISPQGDLIISAGWNGEVKVWEVQAGQECLTLNGHTHRVNGCHFSQAGKLFVSASSDGTVKLWDADLIRRTNQQVPPSPLSATGEVRGCALSKAGDWAVSVSNTGVLKLWDTATGLEKWTMSEPAHRLSSCAISPTGEFIAFTIENSLRVWDVQSGTERFSVHGLGPEEMNCCAICPAGDWIISGSGDNYLRFWDSQTGSQRLKLQGHRDAIAACAISSDGDFVVSGSYDMTLKVWDAKNGTDRLTLQGHSDIVRGCAISPDGSFIVSASRDQTLKVWDATTGRERLTLTGHRKSVRDCAISPSGELIASTSQDNTLMIWDAKTGACLTTLAVNGRLFACAFHPDGKHLIAAGGSGFYFLQVVL